MVLCTKGWLWIATWVLAYCLLAQPVDALFGSKKQPKELTYLPYRAPVFFSDPTTINKTILEDWRASVRKRDKKTVCKKRFYAIDEFKYNRLEPQLWAVEYGKKHIKVQNKTLLLKVSGEGDTRHRIRSIRGMSAGVVSITMTPSATPGVISAISLRSARNDTGRQDEITFEHYASEPTKVQTLNTYHNNFGVQRDVFRSHEESIDYSKGSHTFTIAFSESSTVFYVDDQRVHEIVRTPADGIAYDAPMYLYFNAWDASTAGVGGQTNWLKTGPATMQVHKITMVGCVPT